MKKVTSLHLTPTPKTPYNILLSVNIPLHLHTFVSRINEKNIKIILELLLFISHRTQIILKFYCKMECYRTGGIPHKKLHDILYTASCTCL